MTSEKDFIMKNIFLPKKNLRLAKLQDNAGLLLHGPPGTGKSFLARAIGNVWLRSDSGLKISFVRGPELFSELVGKTEENVRLLFAEALQDLDYNQGIDSLLT